MAKRNIYNEKSTGWVVLSFLDKEDDPVTPLSASYTIHDKDTGTVIRSATNITGLSTSIELELTPTDTVITTSTKDIEEKVITLTLGYGSGRTDNQEIIFNVRNLTKIT